MASPGNQHCASCIGTISFLICLSILHTVEPICVTSPIVHLVEVAYHARNAETTKAVACVFDQYAIQRAQRPLSTRLNSI